MRKQQAKTADSGKSVQEWRLRAAKVEQGTEKSLKSLKDRIKQLENSLRIRDAEISDCKAKINALEEGRNQDSVALGKYRTKSNEKECEARLAEKEAEVRRLAGELEEAARRIQEAERREQKRIEEYSGSALELKDRELTNLREKEAELLSAKMRLARDNADLKQSLQDSEAQRSELKRDNDVLLYRVKTGPQELQARLESREGELEMCKDQLVRAREDNARLEEEVMLVRNQVNSHPIFKKSALLDQLAGPDSAPAANMVRKSMEKKDWITPEGAVALAEEVRRIMRVRTGEEVLAGLSKMTQIVRATHRMEQFIKGVCDVVFQISGPEGQSLEVNPVLLIYTLGRPFCPHFANGAQRLRWCRS